MAPENVSDVRTRSEFVGFVRSLAKDAHSASERWENDTLPRYLLALAAWVEDMDGYYQGRGEPVLEIPWTSVAEMLIAARVYE